MSAALRFPTFVYLSRVQTNISVEPSMFQYQQFIIFDCNATSADPHHTVRMSYGRIVRIHLYNAASICCVINQQLRTCLVPPRVILRVTMLGRSLRIKFTSYAFNVHFIIMCTSALSHKRQYYFHLWFSLNGLHGVRICSRRVLQRSRNFLHNFMALADLL